MNTNFPKRRAAKSELLLMAFLALPVAAIGQGTIHVAHMVTPHYPEIARDAGVQGEVRILVTVGSRGEVIDADATGNRKILRDAAISNIQKWKFDPSFVGHRHFNVFYEFVLREKTNPRPEQEVTIDEEIPHRVRVEANPSPLAEEVAGFRISRADEIHYPSLARLTRITGTVNLFVVIDQAGRVFEVDVESGHPILVPAALDSIQRWKADPPGNGPKAFHVAYEFVLLGKPDAQPREKVTVDLPRGVRIEAAPPICDHCPVDSSEKK